MLKPQPGPPKLLSEPEGTVMREEMGKTIGAAGIEGPGSEDRSDDAVKEARETSSATSDSTIQHLRQRRASGAHERRITDISSKRVSVRDIPTSSCATPW